MLIGLYKHRNPFKSMRQERLQAMAQEALKQNVDLVVFDSTGIDFSLERIQGKLFTGETWATVRVPFPTVVINEAPPITKNRSPEENRFRKYVHLTTHLIGGKISIYEKLAQHEEYKNLVIPSYKVNSANEVFNLMEKYPQLVIKPIGGRQGQSVFFLRKETNKKSDEPFSIRDHTSIKYLHQDYFLGVIDFLIKDKSFMAQPYIECKTKLDEPYDFRVHVQRRGDGQWGITKTYPRIGDKNSILSNISRGGRTEEISVFLSKEFGEHSESWLKKIHNTALGVAAHINSFYQFQMDEVGVDLSIDSAGHMWLYEVNTGPQTRYHEAERAVHTIAYAKYLTEKHQKPIFDNNLPVIALLTGNVGETPLKQACHQAALAHEANFYYFSPSGIQKNRNYVYGYIYEQGRRRYRQLPLPWAVYDRFRARGIKKYHYVYDFLDANHIPLSIKMIGGSLSKNQIYNILDKYDFIKENTIPYKKIEQPDDVTDFLDKYGSVVIKPLQGSFGEGVIKLNLEKKSDAVCFYIGKEERKIKKNDLSDFIQRFWVNKFIIQKFISSYTKNGRPFDIRVHLVRGKDQELHIALIYARIGAADVVVSNISAGGHVRKLDHFLQDEFPNNLAAESFRNKLLDFTDKMKKIIDKEYGLEVPEVGLDIAVDKNKNLWLFEYNINRPDTVFHEYEVANLIIPYLITKSKTTF